MMKIVLSLTVFIVLTLPSFSQVYILPFDRISQIRQDRAGIALQDEVHKGAKPIMKTDVDVSYIPGLGADTSKYYSIYAEKLFSEHLIELDKPDFQLFADIVFDFAYGSETIDEISSTQANTDLFQNTRGFQLQGQIGESVYFFTDFRENQGRYPAYLTDFIDSTGVMPGSGRVKPFRSGGFDYSMAGGFVGINAADWLDLSFGHSKQFIGHGYRSILLSDNAHNYPFASYDIDLFKGKVQHRYTLALLQDLVRLPQGETPESIFQRKTSSWNYLSVKPLPNLEIGIFEQVIWKIFDDSLGSQPFDYRALLPIPGLNSAILGLEDEENNALLGLNASWIPFRSINLYGQILVDNDGFSANGFQLGGRWSGILDRFDLQIEYNTMNEDAGLSPERLQSNFHFNQPMAHVLGNEFDEWVGILTYYKNRILARAKVVHYNQDLSNNSVSSTVLNGDLRFGYIFNPSCNLEVYSGYTYRTDNTDDIERDNAFWYLGIRTNLSNVYRDF